jgi:cytochrome P450
LSIKKDGHIPFLEKQIKKYGPVFGYYVGATPKVAIADVEIAKEIMVKEFENFRDRGNMGPPNLIPKAIGFSTGLVVATGETWRNGRHTLTPSFSAMKMKLMVPLLKRSSGVLMGRMKEFAESEKSVEVFSVYGAFSMETLIATAFGRYVAVQRGEADDITKAADAIFRATEESSAEAPDAVLATLSNFPWLEPQVLKTLRKSDAGKAAKLMHTTAVALIMARKESQQPPKVKDLLQLMIDATVDQNNGCPVTKKLTTEKIAGFSIDFLLAGYETTANTLSYTSYLLAMNTDVQEKLQAEIDEYFEEDPEASLYEAAQKLKYLDMVISETLRLYSPVPKVQRHCYKTVTIGDVTIPEGVDAVIPINAIHRMPQYWPDPLKFDPLRLNLSFSECHTKHNQNL